MARTSASHASLVTVMMLAASLAACAGRGPKEKTQFVEQPVEQLYTQAADLMDQKRWSEAATAFEEVERQHPYSSWARRSMLMQAYVKYQANSYDDAIEAANRFISLHPGNASAPYAYYLISICYFEQILDVGRDQKTTEQALQALQEIVRRYPESEYARDARLKIDMTYDQLAGKEMEVGRFYLSRDQHLAAINRFKTVIENPNFQRTSHTPEALHRLVEAYLSVGMAEEAQKTAAVLGYNFPGNPWYARSFALMEGKGVSPVSEGEAKKRGWLSRAFGRL
ncbi:MAG: outer membrane protein assembly factor BamD [Alphaproteobacteria bacterium]|nr:outer membrane protein assembly factor BamD [Alphaproteobacteria bacterium]